jgi:hypothetical protein
MDIHILNSADARQNQISPSGTMLSKLNTICERIKFILCVNFIVLITSAQQFNEFLNIFECLQHVAQPALKRWSTTSAGIRVFGSVMEVRHAGVVRGFKRAVMCNDTGD